jgi:hypothetical protein
MNSRRLFRLALLIAALGFVFASKSWAQVEDELLGKYRCQGVDTTGAAYSGTVTIEREKDCYRVTWLLSGTKYLGVGIKMGDVFSVAYYGKMSGVIAYQIGAGELKGKWTIANGRGELGTEMLTR